MYLIISSEELLCFLSQAWKSRQLSFMDEELGNKVSEADCESFMVDSIVVELIVVVGKKLEKVWNEDSDDVGNVRDSGRE